MNDSWFSFCDGDIHQSSLIDRFEYYSHLNVVLAFSGRNSLKIYDVNSGTPLQEMTGTKDEQNFICCNHKRTGSIAITDGNHLGYRSHVNGVLVVNTVLQSPVQADQDVVMIELPISEARLLTNFIQDSDILCMSQDNAGDDKAKEDSANIEAIGDLLQILVGQISASDDMDNDMDKLAVSEKWETVKVSAPYARLKQACQTLLQWHRRRRQSMEKKSSVPGYHQLSQSSYGLPVVASMLHQLALLNPADNPGIQGSALHPPTREMMYAELTRRSTFKKWPHADYKYALPHAMAETGFYYQPTAIGDDRAMCFACNVCLVCWEPSDEPWSEHERHSPSCPFVCCEPTTNVPMSVTHATQPALTNPFPAAEGSEVIPKIDFLAAGENSNLVVAAAKSGTLAIWDVSDVIPKLETVCTIRRSSLLYQLRHLLKQKDFPDADELVPANYQLSDLTFTELYILDKLCPEQEQMTFDPMEFSSSSDDHSNKVHDKKQDSEGGATPFPISPSKIPTFVVGLSVTVNPHRFRGNTLDKYSQKDFQEPADKQGTSNETDGENTTKETSLSSHKFSLVLFLKSEKCSKGGKTETTSKHQLSMSKTTLFHPHAMEGIENYEGAPVPNSLGTIHVPTMDEDDFEIMTMPPGIMNVHISPGQTDDIPDAYALGGMLPDEVDIEKLSKMYPSAQIAQMFDQGNFKPKEGHGLDDEDVKQKAKTSLCTILQLLMIDHVSLGSSECRPLQVVNNILATENSHMLLVSTHPEACAPRDHIPETPTATPTVPAPLETVDEILKEEDTNHDTPQTGEPIKMQDGLQPLLGHQEEVMTSDILPVDKPIAEKDELMLEKSTTDQPMKSVVTSTPTSNQPIESEERKTEENCPNNVGKLFIFNIEPPTSVQCVSPKEMTEIDEGTKWIKTSPILQISNLPSDVLQAAFDEGVESLDGEEEEMMREKEEGEKKSEDSTAENSVTPHVLVLTDDGEIGVMDISSLKSVYKIKTSDVLIENFQLSKADASFGSERFTAFAYCSGSDRLCVATDKGRLAFLKIGKYHPGRDPPRSPELAASFSDLTTESSAGRLKKEKQSFSKAKLLVNHPLTNANLTALVQMMEFEPLKPRFSATAPICWTEVQFEQDPCCSTSSGPRTPPVQDEAPHKKHASSQTTSMGQQQRRHLRHPNEQYPSDAIWHTRTWNLQPDCMSWSEHMFEFVFPRTTNVSHLDFKFVLNRKLKPGSDIKLTLLKHPGLTTSRSEIHRSDRRRRWRHHHVQQMKLLNLKKIASDMTPELVYSKVAHLLSVGFVQNLDDDDVENPVLLVIEETTREGEARSFVMMDGSQQTVVAMCNEKEADLMPCDLVVIKSYTRVKVGSEKMRIAFFGYTIYPRKVVEQRVAGLRPFHLASAEEHEVKFAAGCKSNEEKTPQIAEKAGLTPATEIIFVVPSEDEPANEQTIQDVPETDNLDDDEHERAALDRSSILFGPVNLSDYVDASGVGGIVTIASRWLVKECRHRAVLLQIEDANIADGDGRKFVGMQQEAWMEKGCNRLLEISVTVNKFRRLNVPHRRIQRFALLCSRTLHKKLLQGICHDPSTDAPPSGEKFVARSLPQKLAALDILNWATAIESADPNERCKTESWRKNSSNVIANIRVLSYSQTIGYTLCHLDSKFKEKRHKSGRKVSPTKERISGVSEHDSDKEPSTRKVTEKDIKLPEDGSKYSLKKLMEVCFLNSGREVAVRALRLIFHALVEMKNNKNLKLTNGSEVVRDAVLECLDLALERKVESAHGLHCLFQILGVVIETEIETGKDQSSEFTTLLQKCISALSKASILMRNSIHPLHGYLRSRHGLYGTPFDPERFTLEFVVAGSRAPASGSSSMDNATKQEAWEKYFSNEELNIQELVTQRVVNERRALFVGDFDNGLYLTRFGLIECQPLHFTCVDTSDGCTVEVDLASEIDALISGPISGQPTGADPISVSGKKPAVVPLTMSESVEKLSDILSCYCDNLAQTENVYSGKTSPTVKSFVQKMQQDVPPAKRSLPTFMDMSDATSPDIDENSRESSSFSKLPLNIFVPNLSFSLPPSTVLTVPRMHSGVRRSAVLDFGLIVEITDIHIPSCQDLSSMTLDAWVHGSKDAAHQSLTHVGTTLDICDHDFVLNTLAPPVVCRYVRITVIARFGTTNAQSLVNLGRFYGRPACIGFHRNHMTSDLQSSVPSPPKKTMKQLDGEGKSGKDDLPVLVSLLDMSETIPGQAAVQRSVAYLRAYQDDVDCRYNLSCYHLKTLLMSGTVDGSATFRMGDSPFEEQGMNFKSQKATNEKLKLAYKKCSRLQVQRNRVAHSIKYMESILEGTMITFGRPHPFFATPKKAPSYTQLQTYCELMLNACMGLPHEVYYAPQSTPGGLVANTDALLSPELCEQFFWNLVRDGNPRMRVQTTCLLLKFSSPFPWWGEFLAQTLARTFSGADSRTHNMPQKHLFATLLALGQRCLAVPEKAENVIKSLLDLLRNLLDAPGKDGRQKTNTKSRKNLTMNLDLLTWVLLYTSHLIEPIIVQNECYMTGGIVPTEDDTKNQGTATASNNVATSTTPITGLSSIGTVMPFPQHVPKGFSMPTSHTFHMQMAKLGTTQQTSAPGPSTPSQATASSSSGSKATTTPSSKLVYNAKDSRFKNRWSFVSISGEEGKNMPVLTGFTKILNWMQAINTNLKYHKSQLLKIFKKKRNLLKTLDKVGTETQTIEYATLQKKKKELTAQASVHHRAIIGYRKSLDKKVLDKQLRTARLTDDNKKGPESLPFPSAFVGVSVDKCRTVVQSLLGLLLKLDITVASDFAVLACKLSSQLCLWTSSQCIHTAGQRPVEDSEKGVPPPIFLSEILKPDDLKKILLLAAGGSPTPRKGRDVIPGPPAGHQMGPWVNHALTSMLQDILESENTAMSSCENELFPSSYAGIAKYMAGSLDQPSTSKPRGAQKEEISEISDADADEAEISLKDKEENMKNTDLKRVELVDNFLRIAEDFIDDIKFTMKVKSRQTKAEEEKSGLSLPKPEFFPKADSKTSIKSSSSAKISPVVEDSEPVLPTLKPMALFLRKVRFGKKRPGKVKAVAENSHLCSHMYDSRSIHGVSRGQGLKLKLLAMGHLKLLSASITSPPTAIVEGYKDKENDSIQDQRAAVLPLTSFRYLRKSICEIFEESSLYCLPLANFCELVLSLQDTYNETIEMDCDFVTEALTLLGAEGARSLLKAVNGPHGFNFHHHPQLGSLVLDLIKTVVHGSHSFMVNTECVAVLLHPQSGFSRFFVAILTSEMSATNVGPGFFNRSLSLLGPSICSRMKALFDGFDEMSDMAASLKSKIMWDIPNPITSYRHFLISIVHELCESNVFHRASTTPTDGQLVVVEALLKIMTSSKAGLETKIWENEITPLLTIIGHIAESVYRYLSWAETAVRSNSDRGVNPRSCMTGMFSALFSMSSGGKVASPRDTLMLKLLKLCVEFVWMATPRDRTTCPQAANPESMELSNEDDQRQEAMDVEPEQKMSEPPKEMEVDGSKSKSLTPEQILDKYETLGNIILREEEIMHYLLASLALCTGSAMASLFSTLKITPVFAVEKGPVSTGDGVLILLSAIFDSATDDELPVKAILNFLVGSRLEGGRYMAQATTSPTCQLSLPLLWIILSVLEHPEKAERFCSLGGARFIADSLVASSKESIEQSQGRTSQVLQYLTAASDRAAAYAPRPPVALHSEGNWMSIGASKAVHKVTTGAQGFNYPPLQGAMNAGVTVTGPSVKVLTPQHKDSKEYDFAAVATIRCSDFSAQPADSLLKPKAVHRRSRAPLWSYHFPDSEHWVSLTLQFPTIFVLRTVKLSPMIMSLSTAPSAVMLEISHSGSIINPYFRPLSVPMATSGMGDIVITSPNDEVVSAIRIHMKRPMDSASIGLTRIVVNGVTNFMSYDNSFNSIPPKILTKSFINSADKNRKSTANWLSLLHHCLTIGQRKLAPMFRNVILEVEGLIPTLCALLEHPTQNILLPTIEKVLLLVAIPEKMSEFVECILKGSSGLRTSYFLGGFSQSASESSVNLIHSLCDKDNADLELRLKEMLKWVSESVTNTETMVQGSVETAHVHAVACGLWRCSRTQAAKNCITMELAKAVYESSKLSDLTTMHLSSPLKASLDWLLCSFCDINAEIYIALLGWMGLHNVSSASISLTNGQIATLTAVSQTEDCIKILGSQGIVQMFSNGLRRFCQLLMEAYQIPFDDETVSANAALEVTPVNVVAVIEFFSGLSKIALVQDWLGMDGGAKTWQILLKSVYHVTLASSMQFLPVLQHNALLDLQESTIDLLKRVTNCNEKNQELLTTAICDIISSQPEHFSQPTQLSGFVRSLLLRVVLEDERCVVVMTCSSGEKFYKGGSNSFASSVAPLRHPLFGTGHFSRTYEVGASSSLDQVWAMASDAPFGWDKSRKRTPKTGPQKPSENDLGNKKPIAAQVVGTAVPFGYPPPPSMTYAHAVKPPASTPSIFANGGSLGDLLISVVTGENAQLKRKSKVAKPSETAQAGKKGILVPSLELKCLDIGAEKLKQTTTLSQLLTGYKSQSKQTFLKRVTLDVHASFGSETAKDITKEKAGKDEENAAMETNRTETANKEEIIKDEDPVAEVQEKPIQPFQAQPLKTMLEVFASLDGLALVAERLPNVTLDIGHTPVNNFSQPQPLEPPAMGPMDPYGPYGTGWMDEEDWFGFEEDSEICDDVYGQLKMFPKPPAKKPPPPPITNASSGNPCVPSHTMSALCFFLRVPHFAEEFLSKQKAARCLLRLLLGVQDDGAGEQILKLDLAQSLPMLPFTAICTLLSRHEPLSELGLTIRDAMTFDTTSIHLVLACLSRFTQNEPDEDTPAGRLLSSLLPEQEVATPINVAPLSYKGPTAQAGTSKKVNFAGKQGEKSYWAKGTGFGTGSTTSDWDVGNAVKKQKKNEGYVTILLEVLSNFVCPDTHAGNMDESKKKSLPMDGKFKSVIPELLSASGLIPAIASYLRNDSVLDIAHHVPLYCSLLSVIRSFTVCPVLCRLLMDSARTMRQSPDGSSGQSSDTIVSLLSKMRKCIDTYASRLKSVNTSIDSQGEEGLTTFVLNVQKTESMLTKYAEEIRIQESSQSKDKDSIGVGAESQTLASKFSAASLEKRYVEEMKNLQFDTAELVAEQDNGDLKFPSGHHFHGKIKEASNVSDASRARRLAQETVTLSNSLPLSHSSTVFVRCDEERLDVMKVLITGPSDTPYSNGCFEFDIFFPADYNNSPPLVSLRTTGNGSVRFNPNLYNDGKVCLSILNTWHGRPEEKWNPQTSSFLQILVSVQSLIFVSEPYFNEPGYERSRGTPMGEQSSREYDANIQQATVRYAMLEQLKNPSSCFKDVIQHHFWMKQDEIVAQCDKWMAEMKKQANERQGRRVIAHSYTALQRHVTLLKSELAKLKCPEGLMDMELDVSAASTVDTVQETSNAVDKTEASPKD